MPGDDRQPRQHVAPPDETLLTRFEEAWASGRPPSLEDLVAEVGPLREDTLVELVLIDLENQLRRGQKVRVEAYLDRFPPLSQDPALVEELLFWEFRTRHELDSTVSIEEYHDRFPALFGTLQEKVNNGEQVGLNALVGCVMQAAGREEVTNTFPPRRPADGAPEATVSVTPSDLAGHGSWGDPADVRLPGYEMLGLLGRGGMGIVYKARQTALDRTVAVKMILPGGHNREEDLARFRTEAESVARLQHPGIVQIYEVGEHEGRPYICLEFCPGGSLDRKLAGTPLQALEAASLVEKLARAMHAAHTKGVIHRDLKPANVLLAEDGTPKITDFGLARKLDQVGLTQTGEVKGTPPYMAPEQVAGNTAAMRPACDVYSLGAVLYECLTGRPPFKAATIMDTLMQVVGEEPVPPSRLNPKVPLDLETVCLKCLEKEPAKRYDSALSLADDLARFARNEPIAARPVGRCERLWRWCRRNRELAFALAAAVLILLAGVAASSYFAVKATLSAREARSAQQAEQRRADLEKQMRQDLARQKAQTEMALRASEQERRRSDFIAYAFRIDAARQAAQRGEPAEARAILGTCDPRFCRWEHDFILRQTIKLQLNLAGHSAQVNAVAFSPDGTRLASASHDGTVRVWDARTGAEALTLKGHTSYVASVCFSPDGGKIATAGWDRTVRVWDARTGEEALTLKTHAKAVTGVCFSPDGTRIASGSWDRTVKVWDAETGREALTLWGHNAPVWAVSFSPDGQRIASGGGEVATPGELKVWDAATGTEVLNLRGHNDLVLAVCFGAGGRIVSGGWDQTARVWDARSGEELFTLEGHTDSVWGACFSPDGSRIATGSQDRTVKVWDARTGDEVLHLTGHSGGVAAVCFSPDGRRVASAGQDRDVKVWNAEPHEEPLTLTGHTDSVWCLAFSPDGRRVAAGSEDMLVKVWDVATGERALTLTGHGGAVTGVAFSPDGTRVVSGGGEDPSPGELKVWDARTGKKLLTLPGHAQAVTGVAFSPDGTRIASASHDRTVKVWDAVTGKELLSLRGHTEPVLGVCFSPDGKRIATASHDRTARVWDAATGASVLTLEGHVDSVWSVSFSLDGRRIVTGGGDKLLKVWDASTGAKALTLRGHTEPVLSVCFSPDGTRIASGGWDRAVKVWDAQTGEEALTLKGHSGGVTAVCFSPDGKRIASGGWDSVVKVWDAYLEE